MIELEMIELVAIIVLSMAAGGLIVAISERLCC